MEEKTLSFHLWFICTSSLNTLDLKMTEIQCLPLLWKRARNGLISWEIMSERFNNIYFEEFLLPFSLYSLILFIMNIQMDEQFLICIKIFCMFLNITFSFFDLFITNSRKRIEGTWILNINFLDGRIFRFGRDLINVFWGKFPFLGFFHWFWEFCLVYTITWVKMISFQNFVA